MLGLSQNLGSTVVAYSCIPSYSLWSSYTYSPGIHVFLFRFPVFGKFRDNRSHVMAQAVCVRSMALPLGTPACHPPRASLSQQSECRVHWIQRDRLVGCCRRAPPRAVPPGPRTRTGRQRSTRTAAAAAREGRQAALPLQGVKRSLFLPLIFPCQSAVSQYRYISLSQSKLELGPKEKRLSENM